MGIESAFINLVRGNRLSMYMGLQLDSKEPPRFAKDYSYVEVAVREFWNPTEEKTVTKALRNQHLLVRPACVVNLKGSYKVLVKTNPKLQEVCSCPALLVLDVGEGEQPSFYATFRKDFDVSELDWCVRLYMFT